MKTIAYQTLANREDRHWYYRSRREMIKDLVTSYILPVKDRLDILDVGCGSGATTHFLSQWGNVQGIEFSDLALQLLKEKYPDLEARQGSIEHLESLVGRDTQDLVTALSVLMHAATPEPKQSLTQINRVLRRGGWVIWNDPIYPVLRRRMDELVSCKRRFLPSEMKRDLKACGFEVLFGSPLTFWGFPMALCLAWIHRFKSDTGNVQHASQSLDQKTPFFMINEIMYYLSYSEWCFSRKVFPVPAGVSYMVIAKKIKDV